MQVNIDTNPAKCLANDLVAYLRGIDAPHVAVSGGSTPRALFQLLAQDYRDAVNWDRVSIWQVDERTVPPDHADSNWRMLSAELLQKLPGLTSYRMKAERDGADLEYERMLRSVVPAGDAGIPQLDLVLLGMGADGHAASLFPGTAALDETDRLVVRNEVPQLNTHRVTMTYPLLNAARERWFLVAGADKNASFKKVQQGELPASRIVDPTWYMDPAAAAYEG